MRFFILVITGLLAACAGPKLPAPNSADVRYDGRDRVVQVMVSNLQPPTAAALLPRFEQRNRSKLQGLSGRVMLIGRQIWHYVAIHLRIQPAHFQKPTSQGRERLF